MIVYGPENEKFIANSDELDIGYGNFWIKKLHNPYDTIPDYIDKANYIALINNNNSGDIDNVLLNNIGYFLSEEESEYIKESLQEDIDNYINKINKDIRMRIFIGDTIYDIIKDGEYIMTKYEDY